MGRLHKKKLAEYAEAAENEEQQKRNSVSDKGAEEPNIAEGSAGKSVNSVDDSDVEEQEAENVTDASGADEAPKTDEDVEDISLPHEDEKAEKNGGAKKAATKRRASKKHDNVDGDSVEDSDDAPLNGSEKNTPAKRGRKAVAVKAIAKVAKSTAANRGRSTKTVQEKPSDEEEEEYEVKDIVDHKVERGTTFYLIRWKGYTKDDDTWEAADTLSCPDIIEKYNKKISNNGIKSSQKKRPLPEKKSGKGIASKSAPKEDPNKEWEVEKIIDYAIEKTGRIFRIRWKGFGPKNDTWEPEKNLYCDSLIQKFMKRMESQKNISFKELRETPKKTKRLVNETAPRTNYQNRVGRKSKRSVSKKRY